MHSGNHRLDILIAEYCQAQAIASVGMKPEVVRHQTKQQLRFATFSEHLGITDVFVVADLSKIGRRSLGVIAEVTAAHHLITDEHITPADREKLRELGIDVIIA